MDTQNDIWKWSKVDGSPSWSQGATDFDHIWNRAFELLKFERGQGFKLTNRETGKEGPIRTLGEVKNHLETLLMQNPDSVIEVRSVKTDYALIFRRTIDKRLLGENFLGIARELTGAPYVLGGTSNRGVDCSGIVIYASDPFGIHYSEHRAWTMWQEFKSGKNGKIIIPRQKILKGDLLIIHGGDHIAVYVDDQYGGRVFDAQPHSVTSPWGWTPSGAHIRSMAPNYYCSWENVNAVCRLTKINGEP